MQSGSGINIDQVCKRHGSRLVLDHVSFRARPGRVTAFLGPNGAGKSSTLRILLGLDRATAGTATFGPTAYREFRNPLRHVGAQFDDLGGVPSRRVRTQLRILAATNGIPLNRVEEVLELAGVSERASARLGTLSLGEGQRVGLAAAMLGDPENLVLDEPTNGLDPGGIRWIRGFLRNQAEGGKTVLLSSHLLSEVEQVADDVVVIDHGRIVGAGPIDQIRAQVSSLEDLFFQLTDGR
jgi:ABC-2 type transport system ATP-binding protein